MKKNRPVERVLGHAAKEVQDAADIFCKRSRVTGKALRSIRHVDQNFPAIIRVPPDHELRSLIRGVSRISRYRWYDKRDHTIRAIAFLEVPEDVLLLSAENMFPHAPDALFSESKISDTPIDLDHFIFEVGGRKVTLPSPWRGKNPLFFLMHTEGWSGKRNGSVGLRRPAHLRKQFPNDDAILELTGDVAADMLWNTGSFQNSLCNAAGRPIVCIICNASEPGTDFGKKFASSLFGRKLPTGEALHAPIYTGKGKVGLVQQEINGSTHLVPQFEGPAGLKGDPKEIALRLSPKNAPMVVFERS